MEVAETHCNVCGNRKLCRVMYLTTTYTFCICLLCLLKNARLIVESDLR